MPDTSDDPQNDEPTSGYRDLFSPPEENNQDRSLTCDRCGHTAVYAVGVAMIGLPDEDEDEHEDEDAEPEMPPEYYTKYFRCNKCGGAGPFTVADWDHIFEDPGSPSDNLEGSIRIGRTTLFDGTSHQTAAMSEEHLLGLMKLEPDDGFLCGRMGNLLQQAGEPASAREWYEKAVLLDPDDTESRYHLFEAAHEGGDFGHLAVAVNAMLQSTLEGKVEDPIMEKAVVGSVLQWFVKLAPADADRLFMSLEPGRVRDFLETVRSMEGDANRVVDESALRLLCGEFAPENASEFPRPVELIPPLRELVRDHGLHPQFLEVAWKADEEGVMEIKDRTLVPVTDGHYTAVWRVPSLRALFRGERVPPPDRELFVDGYLSALETLDNHLLAAADEAHDVTDQEIEEIFSSLRRRPDGRTLNTVHAFLWQASALILGTHTLSQTEFEAIFAFLEKMVRIHWERPVSRNYLAFLREGPEDPDPPDLL